MNDAWDGAEASFRPGQEQPIDTTDVQRSMLRDGYAVSYGLTTSDQSGLPLTMRDGVPVEPGSSAGRAMQLFLKRLLVDVPIAALGLLALSPLLIGVALAIRVAGKGPVLVRQVRVGLNGQTFGMLTFRTHLAPLDRWLRDTGIDELPQLWNVLTGDMALVGPRPTAPESREAVPYSDYRHRMRPGLTGWAQAGGLRVPSNGAAATRAEIDHDCAYVQSFSLILDFKIIIRAIGRDSRAGSGH